MTLFRRSAIEVCNTTFANPTYYALANSSTPISVAIADVNGDGKNDTIVAYSGSNNVGIFLNSGIGTFTAQANPLTIVDGTTPVSVTTDDVNGDGKIDIIVAYSGSNNVGVFLNSGTGTFTAQANPLTIANGKKPVSVTTDDVNGDGKIDIIVAYSGSNNVGVFLNSGTATFTAQANPLIIAGTTTPESVTTDDVNGDGKLDIIVAYSGSNNVGVFLNSGTGTFTAQPNLLTIAGTTTPVSVTTADVNGDGKPDIIVAYSGSNNVGVFLNSGTGTFTAQTNSLIIAGATTPVSVVAGDVNADGKPDIIVAYSGSNNLGAFLNSGTGTFTAQTNLITLAGATTPASVVAGDVNADGKPDIIVAYSGSNNVGIFLNDVTITFIPEANPLTIAGATTPMSVTTTDVNGDGKPDIIVAYSGSKNVGVFLNNGTGAFILPSSLLTSASATTPLSVTTADINGDHKTDLVVSYIGSSDNVGIFLNDGAGGFPSQPVTINTGTGAAAGAPVSVATGDIDGDTYVDIIVAFNVSNKVAVFYGRGNTIPTLVPNILLNAAGATPESVTTADVNGDGKADVIVAYSVANNVAVFLSGSSAMSTSPSTFLNISGAASPVSVTTADVNGDGKVDIIVAYNASNNVGVFLNSGAGTFTAQANPLTIAGATSPVSVTAGDVNGDSKADIIVTYKGSNNVGVFLNSGTGTFTAQGSPLTIAGAISPVSVTTADINGDTKTDIVVAYSGSDKVGIFLNTATVTFTAQADLPPIAGATTPTFVTEADVNADGKVDIIMAYNASNNVGIFLNSGTGTFTAEANPLTIAGAISPVSVTTADVNGDSKADIIVTYKGSNNVGVFLNSGTGTFTAQANPLTIAGAASPVSVTTADVNGDGKADIIVAYSSSNNVGVFLNSGTGTFTAQANPLTIAGATSPVSVTTADVNGDGKADLIVAYSSSNNVGIFLNSGTGIFTAQANRLTIAGATSPVSVTTGDVNGDGKADIIVAYITSNNVGVFLNSGIGTFPVASAFTYGFLANSATMSVTTADVNGRGKLDIIVVDNGSNNFGVLLNSGTGTFPAAQVTYGTGAGTVPASMVAGDVNGDGRVDMVVANSGTNNVGVFIGVCS
ncbi:unnamed protein product [Rotaria sp. Silwood2]|nr:unnamed protein product [Rotaria sp. Silwood2]CAF4274503.1 unnamed protein product [Rotaria sp. Silwood2]